MQRARILYFTKSALVSEAEELDARKYLACDVLFRFSQFAAQQTTIEKCDAVLGKVPENYSHLPLASELFEVVEVKPLQKVSKQIEKTEPVKTQSVKWVAGK